MINNTEVIELTANKIRLRTTYNIDYILHNMHVPMAYELLLTNLTNFRLTSNQQSFYISDFPFTNNKYTIMFLQLGYTGVSYMQCDNSSEKFPVVNTMRIPYSELRGRNTRLRRPLQFYDAQGKQVDYLNQNNRNIPFITAANSNREQYISYYKIEFNNNKTNCLPRNVYDNRELNNEVKFYFTVGGINFQPNLYSNLTDVPVFIDKENNQYYLFNEIALVAIRDSLIQSNFNSLFNASNINPNNFKIYAYKYLEVPLLIGADKIVEIEWSVLLYLK